MRTGTNVRKGKRSARPSPTEPGPSAPSEGASAPTAGAPAKKGKDPLLAGICHDLRAPLAAVMMGANFVLQTTPDDGPNARSRRVLSAILRSCKQMERLVRDFGDLSEIEGDAVELRVGLTDAGEMAELAAQAARPEALTRKVMIRVDRPEHLPIHCDRDRMLRALAHVIDNAVRFSPEGGTVVISVADDSVDGHALTRFAVHDEGPGISDETMAHLYDRTWHAKRPGRTGAGLGLAIARGITQAHSGQIEIDTRSGSTKVSLVLPKDVSSAPPPEAMTH